MRVFAISSATRSLMSVLNGNMHSSSWHFHEKMLSYTVLEHTANRTRLDVEFQPIDENRVLREGDKVNVAWAIGRGEVLSSWGTHHISNSVDVTLCNTVAWLEPGSHMTPNMAGGGYRYLYEPDGSVSSVWTDVCRLNAPCDTITFRLVKFNASLIGTTCQIELLPPTDQHYDLSGTTATVDRYGTCAFTDLLLKSPVSTLLTISVALDMPGAPAFVQKVVFKDISLTASQVLRTVMNLELRVPEISLFRTERFREVVSELFPSMVNSVDDVVLVSVDRIPLSSSSTAPPPALPRFPIPSPECVHTLQNRAGPSVYTRATAVSVSFEVVSSNTSQSLDLYRAIVSASLDPGSPFSESLCNGPIAAYTSARPGLPEYPLDLTLEIGAAVDFAYDYLVTPGWHNICFNGLACRTLRLRFRSQQTASMLKVNSADQRVAVAVRLSDAHSKATGAESLSVRDGDNLSFFFTNLTITSESPEHELDLCFSATVNAATGPKLCQTVTVAKPPDVVTDLLVRTRLRITPAALLPQRTVYERIVNDFLSINSTLGLRAVILSLNAEARVEAHADPSTFMLAADSLHSCGVPIGESGTLVVWKVTSTDPSVLLDSATLAAHCSAFVAMAVNRASPLSKQLCGVDEATAMWDYSEATHYDDAAAGAAFYIIFALLVVCCIAATGILCVYHRGRRDHKETCATTNLNFPRVFGERPPGVSDFGLQVIDPVDCPNFEMTDVSRASTGATAYHDRPSADIAKLQREIDALEEQRAAVDRALARYSAGEDLPAEGGAGEGGAAPPLQPFAPLRVPLDGGPLAPVGRSPRPAPPNGNPAVEP
ncbi:hypothetical protein DIPPA_05540 [Diplonema papillatum]|nr:hypothetical protein DIPPA_05540 [Diplonema papillatum]